MHVRSDDPKVLDYLMRLIGSGRVEHLHAIFTDEQSHYLADERIAQGEQQRVSCSLTSLFERASALGAKRFLLAHNHPSGDLNPSSQDRDTTVRIASDAASRGMTLIDHLVVTGEGAYSLRFGTRL